MAKKVFVFVLATAILFSVQLANTQPTGKVWRIGLFHCRPRSCSAVAGTAAARVEKIGLRGRKERSSSTGAILRTRSAANAAAKEFVRNARRSNRRLREPDGASR